MIWPAPMRVRGPESSLIFTLVTAISLWTGIITTSSIAETLTVTSIAIGQTRQDAIDKALIQAVEQVTGVKLQSNRELSESLSSRIEERGVTSSQISESFRQEAKAQSGGIVKSFEVESVEQSNEGVSARLKVSIEHFVAPGLGTQNRRRIVVAPPTNLAGLSINEVDLFRVALNSYLIQTRRFAVLDRENDTTYKTEIDVLKSREAALSEASRIGQIIGADYVLLSTLRRFESIDRDVILPITEQHILKKNSVTDTEFTVVEIATRQIKWAGQVTSAFDGDRELAIKAAARQVGERTVNDIYPLRVVQIIRPSSIVINQGADTIRIGETYTLNKLGEMAYDPYTKEPLGKTELRIGTIRISRVDPKLSYGELIDGTLPDDDAEIGLRSVVPLSEKTAVPANSNIGPKPRW